MQTNADKQEEVALNQPFMANQFQYNCVAVA